jgi:hypothetical protein
VQAVVRPLFLQILLLLTHMDATVNPNPSDMPIRIAQELAPYAFHWSLLDEGMIIFVKGERRWRLRRRGWKIFRREAPIKRESHYQFPFAQVNFHLRHWTDVPACVGCQ